MQEHSWVKSAEDHLEDIDFAGWVQRLDDPDHPTNV